MKTKRHLPRRSRGGGQKAYLTLFLALALGCAASSDPARYRLAASGDQWETAGEDRILEDVRGRYPAFFEAVLDAGADRELDLRSLRDLATPQQRQMTFSRVATTLSPWAWPSPTLSSSASRN